MGISVDTIETLMLDVWSGDLQVAALTPDETFTLTDYVQERRDQLRTVGYSLPPLPERADDTARRGYLVALADLAHHDDIYAPDAYAINGEQRLEAADQRYGFRRFTQAHADEATEKARERVTSRLRKALAPFHLAEGQVEQAVSVLSKTPCFYLADDGSPIFDFNQKVTKVVEMLGEKGAAITKDAYVKACLSQSNLFYANPQTIVLNLTGKGEVRGEKRTGFLTLLKEKYHIDVPVQDYAKACLASPRLFNADPRTILVNLTGHGQVRGQPRTGFVTLLKEQHNINVPLKTYVKACLATPTLFSADPQTVMLNLAGKGEVKGQERTGFVTLLKERHHIDVPLKRYVETCLSAPGLFYRDPQTICNNVSLILGIAGRLREAGHVFPKPQKFSTPPKQPAAHGDALLIERLLKTPFVLALQPDNLGMRELYAVQKYKDGDPVYFSIFTDSRETAENTIIKALGGEPGKPVAQKMTEKDMENWDSLPQEVKEAKAGGMVLRALIQAGVITHASLPPGENSRER